MAARSSRSKRLLRALFGRSSRTKGRISEEEIDRAIRMVMEGTDPRLRLVSGYKRKLRRPVIRSLLYLKRLPDRIPGPFEVSSAGFGSDPQINALFASADDMHELFGANQTVRDFFAQAPDCDVGFCSLGMYREEKHIFGMELEGGMVRKDVAQVAVNFSGHWVGVCAASLEELKQQLMWRGFHSLTASALARIVGLKAKTTELERQRILLKAKLREIKAQARGLEPVVDTNRAEAGDRAAVQHRLDETERQLGEAKASLGTLDDYLRQIRQVLSHPSRYLKVKPRSVHINRMGIKARSANERGSVQVLTAQISLSHQAPFDAVLVTPHHPKLSGHV
jgi:hypothetical protein